MEACDDDQVSRTKTLPPHDSNRSQSQRLDTLLREVLADLQPTKTDFKIREKVVKELQEYLRTSFTNAVVHVFGSTASGFCFHNSDIDVSIRLLDTKYARKCAGEVLEEVSDLLALNPNMEELRPILSAKVPVIKYKDARSQLWVDLSLHNTEGIQTTKWLHTYSLIDERFKTLVYCLKVMVKLCGYEGYRGYFPVSIYVFLVIYYLQQRKPPVLPVLHELYQGEKPELEEGDLDVYYYSDIPNLARVWSQYGENTESVGELWLGLLQFYSREYDPHAYIVSLRQLDLLPNPHSYNKERHIAHESPLQVGLVRPGVSTSDYNNIVTMFENAYDMFSNLEKKPESYETYKDYAFDSVLLTKPRYE